MTKCPLCKYSYAKKPHCAIRLFNSSNECVICMENKPDMHALPCGHQFCQGDLATLGIFPVKKKKTKKRKRSAASSSSSSRGGSWAGAVARASASSSRASAASSSRSAPRRRLGNIVPVFRRCGWCGHHGHNIRKCEEHRLQCNCSTFRSPLHKTIHRNKVTCQTCHKRGHEAVMCAVVILV